MRRFLRATAVFSAALLVPVAVGVTAALFIRKAPGEATGDLCPITFVGIQPGDSCYILDANGVKIGETFHEPESVSRMPERLSGNLVFDVSEWHGRRMMASVSARPSDNPTIRIMHTDNLPDLRDARRAYVRLYGGDRYMLGFPWTLPVLRRFNRLHEVRRLNVTLEWWPQERGAARFTFRGAV